MSAVMRTISEQYLRAQAYEHWMSRRSRAIEIADPREREVWDAACEWMLERFRKGEFLKEEP